MSSSDCLLAFSHVSGFGKVEDHVCRLLIRLEGPCCLVCFLFRDPIYMIYADTKRSLFTMLQLYFIDTQVSTSYNNNAQWGWSSGCSVTLPWQPNVCRPGTVHRIISDRVSVIAGLDSSREYGTGMWDCMCIYLTCT